MYLQILLGIIGFTLNLIFFVTSKLSLLFLLHQSQNHSRETWIAALSIVLAFPEIFAFVQLIWCTSFLVKGKFRSWPSIPGILSGVLCAILEAVSLVFFTLRVGPKLHPLIFIPLLSGVLTIKTFVQNFSQESRFLNNQLLGGFRTKYVKNFRYAISGIMCLSFIIGISCVAGFHKVMKLPEVLILSSSILGLSFTWCPGVQYFTIRSRDGTVSGRQNGSILYTLFRLITIFFIVICVLWLERRADLTDAFNAFIRAFSTIHASPNLKYGLVVHILTGLLFHLFTYLSTRTCMTWTGIYLPTVLATPIVLAFVIYDDITKLGMITNGTLTTFTVAVWICVLLACLLWLLPFLTFASKYTQCPDTMLKPREANFFSYSYNNIFLEHQLHLNYKPLGFVVNEPDTDTLSNDKEISKIFICTTMYREADFEMERLLKSLQKISLSEKIRHVYLESHIIMDNGVQGKTLSEFSLQLLWLLQTKLDVALTDVLAHQMPYGLQLQWILKGGMPLFLHLKDNDKVKPKKRWSQIMYMNYIINFRIKRCYDWLEKQSERFDLMGAINARYEIPERGFSGLDSLNCSMDTESQSLKYSDSVSTREQTPRNSIDSDIGIYTSDDMYSAYSDDSDRETETSSRVDGPTLPSYKNQNYLTVPKTNGKVLHSAINPNFVNDSDDSQSTNLNGVINGGGIFIEVPPPKSKFVTTISGDVIKDEDLTSLSSLSNQTPKIDNYTYILATDADMKFDVDSIIDVLTACNSDLRLGGACGRTHPIGDKSNPVVWFQMFEYAKDFWMIKSAQNIIGSVMCCPGCFSLYRIKTIKDLLQTYSQPSLHPSDVFIKDTGEDRWMCTLMMLNGWKLKFCTFGLNTTYCPSNLDEFLKQRRRWMLSDLANTFLVMRHIIGLIRHNACFSVAYVLYLMQLFFITIISPGSTVIMITAGLDMVFDLNFIGLTVGLSVIIIFYAIVCLYGHSKFQTNLTMVLTLLLGTSITCVFVGGAIFVIGDIITDMEQGTLQFQEHYILILLTSSVFYAAILHPHETWIIFLGLFYMFMFPSMHILLPVYSICNIIDQSWGTRDDSKAVVPNIACFPKIRRRKRKKKSKKKNSKSPLNDYNLPLSNKTENELEYKFWKLLRDTLIGKSSHVGLDKEKMAKRLWKLRTKSIIALFGCNFMWIAVLSYLFSVISDNTSKLNSFAMISGFLYGISFAIQLIGMTVHRTQDSFERLVRYLNKDLIPEWVISKSRNTSNVP